MNDDPNPAPGPLSGVDQAFLLACRAWAGARAPGLFDRFPPARRASLAWAWEHGPADDPAAAARRLRRDHAAQARPDLARVHSSWWARALRDEPESVRRAVVAGLPPGLGDALRSEFRLTPDDLAPDHEPDRGALAHALTLWSAQLVGDSPERDDDPPVVVALTRVDAPTVAALVRTAGLAKRALVDPPPPDLDPKDRGRLDHFRAALASIDARFLPVAARDVERLGTGPQALAQAGMTTLARLLLAADPYRARWALQHLPYSTARALRGLMGRGLRRAPMLARWESELLRAALALLRAEGRIAAGTGAAP